MDLDNKVEQPNTDSPNESKQPDTNNGSQTFDLGDGNKVTLDELKKSHLGYKNLQADYTKKSQELSELKNNENNLSDDDVAAIEALKKA
jgi:hypothetical protein